MSNLFIRVEIAPEAGADPAVAARLAEVCPVDVYAVGERGEVRIIEENLDECVLCQLCVDAAPEGAVTIHKLYERSAA